jgi:hypothetical protein
LDFCDQRYRLQRPAFTFPQAGVAKSPAYTVPDPSNSMKEIRLKISDLYEIEPQTHDEPKELAAITTYVLKHYAFLPKPIAVTVEGDEVVISYPEEVETDARNKLVENVGRTSPYPRIFSLRDLLKARL